MESTKRGMNLREDLTCAICCDLFRDPVMLGCMHHFCKRCISTYWRNIHHGLVTCPQCRQEFPTRQFQTNYLVAGLVDKVRASSSDGYVKNVEKQLKESLVHHRSKREDYIKMIHKDKEQVDTLKKVSGELQTRIQTDFQALHSFLQEEEASLLEQLRLEREEWQQALQRHLQALEAALQEVEQNLAILQQAADIKDANVLLELPDLNTRSMTQLSPVPDFDSHAFSSKFAAPTQYTTWRKMFQILKPGPAQVTFDEDTAHPSLVLSRDKTTVVELPEMQPYRPHPSRFVQCVNVLGAQGFTSGRHYWEVAVGAKTKWDLGVALETVDRRARVKLCPENGYWTLRLREGTQYSAGTQPWTRLRLAARPRRVGVLLDCEERRVAFYDADDMTLLHSFSDGPRGRALPFVSTCVTEPGQRPQPLRFIHLPVEYL
ncbi:tripartite motif containing 105 [Engraulis encrasicolus]|uniref:tripartite motif containing 105 n=1 Tax=Engraulis encrasicolus TaxID=184585 RepID=UPI002FD3466B